MKLGISDVIAYCRRFQTINILSVSTVNEQSLLSQTPQFLCEKLVWIYSGMNHGKRQSRAAGNAALWIAAVTADECIRW